MLKPLLLSCAFMCMAVQASGDVDGETGKLKARVSYLETMLRDIGTDDVAKEKYEHVIQTWFIKTGYVGIVWHADDPRSVLVGSELTRLLNIMMTGKYKGADYQDGDYKNMLMDILSTEKVYVPEGIKGSALVDIAGKVFETLEPKSFGKRQAAD